MALVAYDYGSDSEEGEEEEPQIQLCNGNASQNKGESGIVKQNNSEKPEDAENIGDPLLSSEISDTEDIIDSNNSTVSNLFQKLPEIKKVSPENTSYDDVVEDYIPKAEVQTKKKTKVIISVPSLSSFDDIDDEPASKKLRKPSKTTSLLSQLPPVKCVPLSNKSFVPNVLTQKNKSSNDQIKKPSRPLIPAIVRKKKEEENKSKSNESDESDVEMPETYDDELWQKVCGKKVVKNVIVEEPPKVEEPKIELAPEPVAPYQGLDNAAFKELVGKKSRMPRNIKLIDVNEDELVAEKDLWMTKSLTDPEYIPKPAEDECTDPTKRKKHHITYLAQKAKANEQELQSQWAASKHNRMQSRAKYGF